MRVLIAINSLEFRGGGVMHVRDLAQGLLQRGHTPIIYGAQAARLKTEFRHGTVPLADQLDQIGAQPDVIHGHNHLKTMAALLHFRGTPAVYTCHSWSLWQDTPPKHPRIVSYIAVDHTCYDRVVYQEGIPDDLVKVVFNAVDLERFQQRSPLPATPGKALVFSNNASEHTYLAPVREACSTAGLTLDVIGSLAGRSEDEPEKLLGEYDLVFAKGRCALESLASGCSVILCDALGAGPLVTSAELTQLRAYNLGRRALQHPVTSTFLLEQIARYDANDAAEVSKTIRATAGRDAFIDATLGIYEDAISGYRNEIHNGNRASEEGRAAARYLELLEAGMARHAVTSQRISAGLLKLPVVGSVYTKLSRALSNRKHS
jgi:hypothetical protein